MLSVPDAGVADDLEGQDGVLVLGRDEAEDGELVDVALQGERVVAGLKVEVWDEHIADFLAVDKEVEGDVAEIERHDRGVGDADVGDEVGAVLQERVAGKNADVADVKAAELV